MRSPGLVIRTGRGQHHVVWGGGAVQGHALWSGVGPHSSRTARVSGITRNAGDWGSNVADGKARVVRYLG